MKSITLPGLGGLVPVFMPLTAWAQSAAGGPGYWHHGMDWGGHMMFGSLMMVLFWGGIILVIVLLVRWTKGQASSDGAAPRGNRALEILEKRFARGDIDRVEFEERKRLIAG